MEILSNGILFGLILSLFIGPVFFSLIQTSMERGFSAGMSMAIGISLSDAIYIFLAHQGVSRFIQNESFRFYLGIGGGAIMLGFGIITLIKSFKKQEVAEKVQPNNPVPQSSYHYIIKGFILNGINPSVLFFWISVVSLASLDYHYTGRDIFWFFLSIIATVLMIDIFKAYLSNRLGNLLKSGVILTVNRVVGVILMVFSIRLFYDAFGSIPIF
jgi:threonine/homoserine/homoserine lactone efflux protein